MRIVVLPGDGIGPEITAATTNVLRAAAAHFHLKLQMEEHAVGHASLEQFGATVRPGLLEIVRSADGLILGPTATADFKDEHSGEVNPSKYFRKSFDLFANLRPAKTYPGLRNRFGAFDLVVVRENTEGLLRRPQHGAGQQRAPGHAGCRDLAPPHHAALLRADRARRMQIGDESAPASHHRPQIQRAEDRRRHVSRHLPRGRRAIILALPSTTSWSTP